MTVGVDLFHFKIALYLLCGGLYHRFIIYYKVIYLFVFRHSCIGFCYVFFNSFRQTCLVNIVLFEVVLLIYNLCPEYQLVVLFTWKDHAVIYIRQCHQESLDFLREDILAVFHYYNVFLSSANPKVSLFINTPQITRIQPSVFDYLSCFLRLIQISCHYIGAPCYNFAYAVFICPGNADGNAWQGLSYRTGTQIPGPFGAKNR